jgi:hypothetical protein
MNKVWFVTGSASGVVNVTRAAVPLMREQRSGRWHADELGRPR